MERPVVVYAASGYTGRLTCEALTRLRIPFVAAGRDLRRLDTVCDEMRGRGADCVATAVDHTPAGLRAVLRGAKVVLNIAGPFSLLGRAVVEAALEEGVHYLDSTGEQDFMLDVQRDHGPAFAKSGLLLSPSAAFLWAPGTAAAEVALETPGIDTLEVVYAPPSLQTVASLQSMMRTFRRPVLTLADRQLAPVPVGDIRRVLVPGIGPRRAARAGGGETVFFLDDARVRSSETYFASDDLARLAPAVKVWSKLSRVIDGERLDHWSDVLVARFKKDPPAEDPVEGRFVVSATGRGAGGEVRVVVDGTSPYLVTGFLLAVGAQAVLEGTVQRTGFASLAQAIGARTVLKRLEEMGAQTTVVVEGARPPRAATAERAHAR